MGDTPDMLGAKQIKAFWDYMEEWLGAEQFQSASAMFDNLLKKNKRVRGQMVKDWLGSHYLHLGASTDFGMDLGPVAQTYPFLDLGRLDDDR